MKTLINFLLSTILFGSLIINSDAQTFTVTVQIKNQPDNTIIFGWVKGDDFTAIDSTKLNQSGGKIKFTFPANALQGIYRIILGPTPSGKIMNEPPQMLDFIFDDENIVFETDFKAPVENLKIIHSKENTVWFEFLAKDKVLKKNIEMLENELDNAKQNGETSKSDKIASDFNQLQMERDMFIVQASQDNLGLFASQMIKNQRHPLLDGYLNTTERNQTFKKEFFKTLDFTNADLIYSSVYTDNIFNYLVSYNDPGFTQKQREEEYIKALDTIVPNIKPNNEVYQFIMGYLVHGFKVLQMNNVISYISKKYSFPE